VSDGARVRPREGGEHNDNRYGGRAGEHEEAAHV
jgi:hypothetical protein